MPWLGELPGIRESPEGKKKDENQAWKAVNKQGFVYSDVVEVNVEQR